MQPDSTPCEKHIMDSTLLQSLMAELSETERSTFENLLSRLEELDGNLQDLTEDERAQLAQLSSSHSVSQPDNDTEDFDTLSAAVTSEHQTANISSVSETDRPTDTEFGVYIIDSVNESLCQGGASTADAIRYAFHNRWMPEKLKNRDVCEDLYYRFYEDIEQANKQIQQHSPSNANNDTVVAVGLAWFTYLYQCYQLVEAEGDI